MGFMDKAKKLAEQAQQKLDEAQSQFNQSSSPQGGQQGGGPRFDDHGRPIPQEPPASGAATTPPAPPGEAQPAEAPPPSNAPSADVPPSEDEAPAPPPPSGGANATPDPFNPLQQ